MANELDQAVFSAKEFTLNLTVSGQLINDFNFKTVTIPGIADAETEDLKLNHSQRKIVTSVGTANDFQFTTVVTPQFFAWRKAAEAMASYMAVLSGDPGSQFAGDVITISGKVLGIDDTQVGLDGSPECTFKGNTEYFNYAPSGTQN